MLGSFKERKVPLGWLSKDGATGDHQYWLHKGAKTEKDEMTSTMKMAEPELELTSPEFGFQVCPCYHNASLNQ